MKKRKRKKTTGFLSIDNNLQGFRRGEIANFVRCSTIKPTDTIHLIGDFGMGKSTFFLHRLVAQGLFSPIASARNVWFDCEGSSHIPPKKPEKVNWLHEGF